MKIKTGLKSLAIIVASVLLFHLFGIGSITKFVFDKFLFTPYNIVGIIMTIVTICGGYVTKRQGHWLLLTLTIISGIVSVFSLVSTVLSWFNINLWGYLWTSLFVPAVTTIGTILIWIFAAVIAIALVLFAIYGIIKLICYIKEQKELEISNKNYESQKSLINEIVKENNDKTFTINNSNTNINNNFERSIENQNNKVEKKEIKEKIDIKENIEVVDKSIIKERKDVKDIILPNDDELKISNNICPSCGWRLIKRVNRKTKEQFRGCTNFAYHGCKFTISDKDYLDIYWKFY